MTLFQYEHPPPHANSLYRGDHAARLCSLFGVLLLCHRVAGLGLV